MLPQSFAFLSRVFVLLLGLGILYVFIPSIQGGEIAEIDRMNPSEYFKKKFSTPVKCDYNEVRLDAFIEDLAKQADVKIVVKPGAFKKGDMSEFTPITLVLKHKIMLKSALILVLDTLNLTFDIKEDEIFICNESQYNARRIIRNYAIADLAASPSDLKELIQKMRTKAEKDAPEIKLKAEDIAASGDGKEIIVEQARTVHWSIKQFLKESRKKDQWHINDEDYWLAE